MIQNKIYNISLNDVTKIVQDLKTSTNLHLVEFQGKEIQSLEDYITKAELAFQFPTTCINSIDRYLDWIRDLDWLDKDSYVLILYDYENFLKQEPSLKKDIIDDFADIILPWWQEEVERCVAGGKAKPFNVYLVD